VAVTALTVDGHAGHTCPVTGPPCPDSGRTDQPDRPGHRSPVAFEQHTEDTRSANASGPTATPRATWSPASRRPPIRPRRPVSWNRPSSA
jgi:hypothetical protein